MLRKVTYKDIDEIVDILREMFLESRYRHLTFNPHKLLVFLNNLLKNPSGILLLDEETETIRIPTGTKEVKVIAGLIIAVVLPFEFADERFAHEIYLYVDPEYRKNGIAKELITEYIKEAKKLGAKEVSLENSTGVLVEETEGLFKKMGFTRYGGNYSMEIK